MRLRRRAFSAILVLLGAAGCGKGSSSKDAGTADALVIQGDDRGGVGGDGSADGGPRGRADGGPSISCPSGSVIDLSTAGTRTGTSAVTSYVGDNQSPPAFQLPAPSCQSDVSNEIIFQYTPRATTRLHISTNRVQTTFDTVAWALDRCATDAVELACNDDEGIPPREDASTIIVEGTAGRPLWIVVSGYIDNGVPTTGIFDLGVTEMVRVSRGGACDPFMRLNYCEMGSSCVTPPAGTAACLPDGALNGRCRLVGQACEMGLGCNGLPGNPATHCVPLVARGMPCDPMQMMNVCTPPDQCVTSGGSSTCQERGYVESSVAMPAFIDACATGMRVSLAGSRMMGHSQASIRLPFSFVFFGSSETELWPDVAGYVVFGATAPRDIVDAVLPEVTEGPAIGAFWGQISLRASPGSDICYLTSGTAPSRTFAIEWLDARAEGAITPATTHLTFEIVLHEATNVIDLVYRRLDSDPPNHISVDGEDVEIGIQSAMGQRFISHGAAVSTMTGLRFTP